MPCDAGASRQRRRHGSGGPRTWIERALQHVLRAPRRTFVQRAAKQQRDTGIEVAWLGGGEALRRLPTTTSEAGAAAATRHPQRQAAHSNQQRGAELHAPPPTNQQGASRITRPGCRSKAAHAAPLQQEKITKSRAQGHKKRGTQSRCPVAGRQSVKLPHAAQSDVQLAAARDTAADTRAARTPHASARRVGAPRSSGRSAAASGRAARRREEALKPLMTAPE